VLVDLNSLARTVIKSCIFLIFVTILFPEYFVVSQRHFFRFQKWEEINSSNILIPKVGPILNSDLDKNNITSIYYSKIDTNKLLLKNIFSELSLDDGKGFRFRIYGMAGLSLGKNLFIQNEFEFDSHGKNDPHFNGVERGFKNGWVGYLQHSSLNYYYNNGHLSIGRGNPYYFNMNESLLINSNITSPEYLWWKHRNKLLQFDWAIFMLSPINDNNRIINFHRYAIENKKFRIGFSEGILIAYQDWSVKELAYVLPASIHLETEENRGINANLIWLIDGMVKFKEWTYYGELLIDDFALDGKSPPQMAFSFGIGKKLKKSLLNIEYIKINRWTGNHCDPIKVWLESDLPIGHSLGSDASHILFSSHTKINKNLIMELDLKSFIHNDLNAVERLLEWPNDLECDHNFNDIELSESIQFYNLSYGINLHYSHKYNSVVNVKLDYIKKDLFWSVGFVYSY